MDKEIYIRVDGNEIIATGHVMRCLSIAEQMRQQGAEVTFLLADDKPCSLIENRGFSVDVLNTVWNHLEQEIDTICNYVIDNCVKVLLLDTYYVTEDYMKKLSKYTRIVYIDDLSKFVHPIQGVVKYNIFTGMDGYEKTYQLAGLQTHCMVGSKYIPLREEFIYQPYEVKKEVSRVLITTGGTDQLNVAYNLLQEVLSHPRLKTLEYHVIVGCFNQNKNLLKEVEREYANVILHENVNNISVWMRYCDVAISAAGTTTYELCACGVPSICMAVADNQEGAVKWERNGYMKYAGNAHKDMQQCMNRCKNGLLEYINDYEDRKQKSVFMQSMVDGYGAKRIAEYLLSI